MLPSRVTVPTHSRPAVAMLPGRSTWSPTCWAAGAAAASPFQLATNLYAEKLQGGRPGPAAVSSTRIFPAFSGPGRAPSPGLGDRAPAGARAAGVLRGCQAGESHERRGRGEPAEVGDLGGQGQRGQLSDPAVAAQLPHHRGQRVHAGPAAPQLGFQYRQLGVAGIQCRQVGAQRCLQRRLGQGLPVQPRAVLTGPPRSPPDAAVALQQRADPLHHPLAVIDQVSPGADQVPHRLLLLAGDPDRGQQPGLV